MASIGLACQVSEPAAGSLARCQIMSHFAAEF